MLLGAYKYTAVGPNLCGQFSFTHGDKYCLGLSGLVGFARLVNPTGKTVFNGIDTA